MRLQSNGLHTTTVDMNNSRVYAIYLHHNLKMIIILSIDISYYSVLLLRVDMRLGINNMWALDKNQYVSTHSSITEYCKM